VGPKASMHMVPKKKSLPCPCWKWNPIGPAPSLFTILTELLRPLKGKIFPLPNEVPCRKNV